MPLFLMGCFPVDFQEAKRPLRAKSVKRPIKVGKRPINERKRPIKAKVLVGVSVGCLMGCFRAPPPWRKTAPLVKRPIKRSMILHRKCRLSESNFLMHNGLHEDYVMNQKAVPSQCFMCNVFEGRDLFYHSLRFCGGPNFYPHPLSPENSRRDAFQERLFYLDLRFPIFQAILSRWLLKITPLFWRTTGSAEPKRARHSRFSFFPFLKKNDNFYIFNVFWAKGPKSLSRKNAQNFFQELNCSVIRTPKPRVKEFMSFTFSVVLWYMYSPLSLCFKLGLCNDNNS